MDPLALRAEVEGQARLLILINAFSSSGSTLQGRVKLAKVDFLLRYPQFFRRAMEAKGRAVKGDIEIDENNIDTRMIRFRYGPWDPAYYALLGALLGRGLIETVPVGRYTGFRVTETGRELAAGLGESPAWADTARRARELKTVFGTVTGTTMKNFVYENFPEVTQARWGTAL